MTWRATAPDTSAWDDELRSLDVYRKDILKRAATATKRKIKRGNQTVHRGDAIADAELYITRNRGDTDVFESLYGVEISKISEFGKSDSFATTWVIANQLS